MINAQSAMASHSLSPVMARLYLFVLQIRTLYLMGDFRQLIQRALTFIPLFHEMLTQILEAGDAQATSALRWFHPFQWAVGACLEVAYACELSWSGHDYEVSSATVPESATLSITPESMACLLGDLLYLARRLLKRSAQTTGWWIADSSSSISSLTSPARASESQPSSSAEAHEDASSPTAWYVTLGAVFSDSTPQPFQRCVWELSHLASLHFSRAGRHRFAVYLGVECARFHAQRREFESASRLFRSHARQCEEDQWWELVSADVQRICAAELALGRAAQAVAACFSLLELAQTSKVQVRRAALDQLLTALVESLAKNEQPEEGDERETPTSRGSAAKMGELITPQLSVETMQSVGSTLDYGDVRVSLSLTNRFPAGIHVESVSVQFSRVTDGAEEETLEDSSSHSTTIALVENNVYLYERASVNLIFVYGDVDVGTYACSSLECVIAGGHKFSLRTASELSALRFEIPTRQSTSTLEIVGPPLLAPATMERVRVVISSESDVVSGGRLEVSVVDECVDTISIHHVELEDHSAGDPPKHDGDEPHLWTVAVPSLAPQQTQTCIVWLVVSDSPWDERRRATIHAAFRYEEASRVKRQMELRRVERSFDVQAPFKRSCRLQRAGSSVFLGVALTCNVPCGILLQGYKLHCNGVEKECAESNADDAEHPLTITQDLNAHLIGQRVRAEETIRFAFALQHKFKHDGPTKLPDKAVLRVSLSFDCDDGAWRTDALVDVPLDALRGPVYELEVEPKTACIEWRRGEEVSFLITVRVSDGVSSQPAALVLAFDAAHDEQDWILLGKQEEQLLLADFTRPDDGDGTSDDPGASHGANRQRSFSTVRRLLPLRVGRVPFPRFVLKELAATAAAPTPRGAVSADATPTSSFSSPSPSSSTASSSSSSRAKSLHVPGNGRASPVAFVRVPTARVFSRQHAKALLVV
ncbi:hypothetical protein PINS_up014478 [Pythium insidiosum]|nr:hypothetical protein PINS_up014478 [Pythium insidiosum]